MFQQGDPGPQIGHSPGMGRGQRIGEAIVVDHQRAKAMVGNRRDPVTQFGARDQAFMAKPQLRGQRGPRFQRLHRLGILGDAHLAGSLEPAIGPKTAGKGFPQTQRRSHQGNLGRVPVEAAHPARAG